MKHFSTLSLALLLSLAVSGQTGIAVPQMAHCDGLVTSFLDQFDIPGATFAMTRNGKLVYARAFGHADLAGQEATQPHHLFRIASVSKPITAIAVMKLVETGQLGLDDKAFGPGGRLADHSYLGTVSYSDNRIGDITVRHLLEHSAGWDRGVDCVPNPTAPYPFDFNACDPIGFPLHVTQTLNEPNPVTEEMHIRFLMQKGLNFTPSTQYAYSNIGYLVLGEIIEAVSGMSYEAYVQQEVLAPIHACDMHIGRNLLADKREREGEYFGNGYTVASLYGTGQQVPWEYGGWNLEAMDAHGGWIATARDLVRLLVAVDGFQTKPDILSAASVAAMTTPSAQNANYAKGWQVNAFNNWWHTGALDGTASIWVRSSGGATWAVILNKRIIDNQANAFWTALDNLPWNCLTQTTTFPTHDLFDVPATAAADLVPMPIDASSLGIAWTPGSGTHRLLVVRAGGPVDAFPLDGSTYTASNIFGQGSDLGGGNYVVYDGTGSGTLLTGLDSMRDHYFRLFEYNRSANTGNHALYQLCRSATATTAGTTALRDLVMQGFGFYPNPAQDWLTIDRPAGAGACRAELYNLHGQHLRTWQLDAPSQAVSLTGLPAQVYVLSVFGETGYLGSTRVVRR